MKIRDWSKVAMDAETWKKTVEQAKTHKELQRQEKGNNGTEWNFALNCCISTPCGRHMQLFLCQFSLCFIQRPYVIALTSLSFLFKVYFTKILILVTWPYNEDVEQPCHQKGTSSEFILSQFKPANIFVSHGPKIHVSNFLVSHSLFGPKCFQRDFLTKILRAFCECLVDFLASSLVYQH